MPPEAIERALRVAWRDAVDEVAGWSPERWREAVAWLRWLPDLPAIEHLMRGGKVPPWMRADPVMRALAYDEPARRHEALAGLPLAPLHPEARRPCHGSWRPGWRNGSRACRKAKRRERRGLEAVLEAVRRHVEAMRISEEPDGRALRNALVARLARRFRRGAGTAVALFAHLVLDGLELERLRAGLMTRRLLPERAEGRSWA
jgi:hypothetical protein